MQGKWLSRSSFVIGYRGREWRCDLLGQQLRQDLSRQMGQDLARHAKAFQASRSGQVTIVDEKYNDLPGRMERVEAVVFPHERRR